MSISDMMQGQMPNAHGYYIQGQWEDASLHHMAARVEHFQGKDAC